MVCVNREDKFIGLSLKDPIVLGTDFKCGELELGSIVDDAQVIYQDGSNALVLDLGNGHLGFAPVSLNRWNVEYCQYDVNWDAYMQTCAVCIRPV